MNSKENDCSKKNIYNRLHIIIYYDQSLGRGREGVLRIIFSRAKWLSTNIKMTKLKKTCGRLHHFGKIVHMAYGKKLTKLQNHSNDSAN